MEPTWKSTLVVSEGGAGNWANQSADCPASTPPPSNLVHRQRPWVSRRTRYFFLPLLSTRDAPAMEAPFLLNSCSSPRQFEAIQNLPPPLLTLPLTVTNPPWSRTAEVIVSVMSSPLTSASTWS